MSDEPPDAAAHRYWEAVRRYKTEPARRIARDLGVSERTVRLWVRRHEADPEAPPPRRGGARPHYHGVPPAEQAAIRARKAEGWDVEAICRKYRRCRSTVRKLTRGMADQRRRKP